MIKRFSHEVLEACCAGILLWIILGALRSDRLILHGISRQRCSEVDYFSSSNEGEVLK